MMRHAAVFEDAARSHALNIQHSSHKSQSALLTAALCVSLSFTLSSIDTLAGAAPGSVTGWPVEAQIIRFAVSPMGNRLAEVARNLTDSRGLQQIEIRPISGKERAWKVVYVGRGIGTILWWSKDEILFVIRRADGTSIDWENIVTGKRGTLLRTHHEISVDAYARRAGLLAYAYSVPWSWKRRNSVRVTGAMTTLELISPKWARWPVQVRVGAVRIRRHQGHLQAQGLPLAIHSFSLAPSLVWQHRHLIGLVSSMKSWRTRIFDLETGQRLHPKLPLFRLMGIGVSGNGTLAVVSNHVERNFHRNQCGCHGSLNVFLLGRHKSFRKIAAVSQRFFVQSVRRMWLTRHGRMFVQISGFVRPGGPVRWYLEEVDNRDDELMHVFRWPHGDLGSYSHSCQLVARRDIAVCVAQTLTEPPKLVIVDLKDGRIRELGKLDPRQHKLNFSFRLVKIPSRFGYYSTGFLAIPPGSVRKRVPLAVMAYGFSERYSKDAQWITSYPVARFVHAGIAVLLINWARTGSSGFGPFAQAKRAEQSAVSLYANAISAVQTTGIRVGRAMVLGWSFGGLFAADAIEKLHKYVAAEIGDPADYNVTEFALGGAYWRLQSRLFFGGPPVGADLKHYQYLDPSGSGRAANGPILLEFVSRNPDAGQFLAEWKATGTFVEAFAYRRSVHWLSVPAEAKISRLRNLYWAEINLLGPRAVAPELLQRVGLTVPPDRVTGTR